MSADQRTRRLQVAESAGRLLAEAGVDQTRRVDVFGLCEQLGLWLAFFPLDGLLGSYLPEGSGGILITTKRPVSIQRYTAAHELGHWRLGHSRIPTINTEEQVLGDTQDESEQLAQIFAAALLMPPPLVYGTLERSGADGDVSPVHAYTLARDAGVSYEAAVRQLAHLGVVSRSRAGELLKIRPLEVKTEIGRGRRPVVGTADVWSVDEQWHGRQLRVNSDDEVVVSLPENRSTGYRWFFTGHEPARKAAPAPPAPQPESTAARLGLGESQTSPADRKSGNLATPATVPSGQKLWDQTNPAARESGNLATFADRIRESRTNQTSVPRSAVNLARAARSEPCDKTVAIDSRMTLVGDRYVTARVLDSSDRDARRTHMSRLKKAGQNSGSKSLPTAASSAIGGELIREAARVVLQELIEAEATEAIGAARLRAQRAPPAPACSRPRPAIWS